MIWDMETPANANLEHPKVKWIGNINHWEAIVGDWYWHHHRGLSHRGLLEENFEVIQYVYKLFHMNIAFAFS